AIAAVNVLPVAGEPHPAERPAALAELRPDVLRHEPRNAERVLDAGLHRLGADVVAVIEGDGPAALHLQHRADVDANGLDRAPDVFLGFFAPQGVQTLPLRFL